ncbi:MAG: 50S ribosomal protein L10 [Candidatus Omnitrophica bacterium]|nr:50S ribosomal protein L10 [Candidatus Omnitrophota bacterium]
MPGIENTLMLKEIKKKLENKNVFFTNFNKVTVKNFSRLRQSLTKNDGQGLVVKNRVARIVLKELGMEKAVDVIAGSMFLVAAEKEPQKISKDLVDFAKGQESFTIKGAFIDGSFQPESYVSELAKLPSREQLLASVVGGMKAPITNFVFGLKGILRSFVVVLNEMNKKKSE